MKQTRLQQSKQLKEYAEANGFKVIETAITSANEIQTAAQSLAKKCDIVFSPTDNTVASSIATANEVFIEGRDSVLCRR